MRVLGYLRLLMAHIIIFDWGELIYLVTPNAQRKHIVYIYIFELDSLQVYCWGIFAIAQCY